jgi:AraC-like DNA-binding protein/quercetin dioxygenase-like cupin family protein
MRGHLLDEFGQTFAIYAMNQLPRHRVTVSLTRHVSFERVARNRIHRHSFFEPCIVISGSGDFEHGSRVYSLREGDLFMADPDVYHEIRSLKTTDLKLYFLAFNITQSSRAAVSDERTGLDRQALAEFMRDHSAYLPGQSHLISLFEHAMHLSRRAGKRSDGRFHRAASLLLLDEIIAALSGSSRLSQEDQSDHQLANRIVAAIENGLHRPLRIASLARECGMSERSLRRRWKGWGRRMLTDEISHRRVERASHLLLLPDISVAEAGYQVGIESAAQFSRIFKSVKRLTPTEYRQKYLGRVPGTLSAAGPFRTEFLDGDREEYTT